MRRKETKCKKKKKSICCMREYYVVLCALCVSKPKNKIVN